MTDWKERAERAEAELARLRAQVPVGWIGPSGFTHNTATNRMWMRESPKLAAKLSPVYAAPPAQPAEPQAQTVCKRTLIELDARLRECSIVGASAADAYDTFYQHMVETALAAQPAEPVQRLSDERAAFEAWHNEYRTQELVRRDDTYYNTHARCRWEGWQARAIESALQPGWRDIETPQGWKLVPVEPSVEMRRAAAPWIANYHMMRATDKTNALTDAYQAMLKAAPKATK